MDFKKTVGLLAILTTLIFLASSLKYSGDFLIPIDHMESLVDIGDSYGWHKYKDIDDNCSANIFVSKGLNNTGGINVQYDFKKDSAWCGIYRPIDFSVYPPIEKLIYHYNGSGAHNSIELKLLDKNERTWGYIINRGTVTEGWRTVEIDIKRDFKYWWGGQKPEQGSQIDLNQIKEVHFAISNKPEARDELGEGFVAIDELEGLREPSILEKLHRYQWFIALFVSIFVVYLTYKCEKK